MWMDFKILPATKSPIWGIYFGIWGALILGLLLWKYAYEEFHNFLISQNLWRYTKLYRKVLNSPKQFPKAMYQWTSYAQVNPPHWSLSGLKDFGIHPHTRGKEAFKVQTLGLHHPVGFRPEDLLLLVESREREGDRVETRGLWETTL